MGVTPLAWIMLGMSTIALLSWISYWVRRRGVKLGMRQYAEDNGLEWLGKNVPDSFLFYGTGLKDSEIVDALKGTLHGTDMVVFTANVLTQNGKSVSVRSQTVVAFPNVHRFGSRQIPPTGHPELFLEDAGAWLVAYYRGAVVGREKLAGWCERMYDLTEKVVASIQAR